MLRSAVANAESRPDLHWNGDDLFIVTAYADEGPTLKRFRPRARGRASAILKRTCHITLELAHDAGGDRGGRGGRGGGAEAPARTEEDDEPTRRRKSRRRPRRPTTETPAEETES